MTKIGDEVACELSKTLEKLEQTDEYKSKAASKLVEEMAIIANELDASGAEEVANVVDDALRVILRNLQPKATEEQEITKEADLSQIQESLSTGLVSAHDRIDEITKALDGFKMHVEAIEDKLGLLPTNSK